MYTTIEIYIFIKKNYFCKRNIFKTIYLFYFTYLFLEIMIKIKNQNLLVHNIYYHFCTIGYDYKRTSNPTPKSIKVVS